MSDPSDLHEHLRHPEMTQSTRPESVNTEISLIELVIVLARQKRLVLGFPLAAAVLTAVYSFLVTPIYTASARLLPPQQSQPSGALLLGQAGNTVLAGGAGSLATALQLTNPSALYVGILKSRTIADALIGRFELHKQYEAKFMEDTRETLAGRTRVVSGKDGIITIEADDEDPKRASELANAYIEELINLTDTLAITEASQRSRFFEKQVQTAKQGLVQAEIALKKTQESTGLIKLDDQGKAVIEAVASLRAQISAKEVEASVMRSFATEQNPDYLRVQQEIAGMKVQLARLEKTTASSGSDGALVSMGKVPEAGLEYIRRLREVKYHEAMFELLSKQYQIAKMDEAKDAVSIQVLDRAVVPERRSSPKRALMILLSTLVALFVAILVAFAFEGWNKVAADPFQKNRAKELWRYLVRK